MTFFFTGLVLWAYVLLLDEIKTPGDMLIITLVPVLTIMAICIKCGSKLGSTSKSIFGQIMLAGVANAIVIFMFGHVGGYLVVPLYLFMFFGIIWFRLFGQGRAKRLTSYERGFQDGSAQAKSR